MMFADRDLAKRLEAAEGYACAQFAEARKRMIPESTSAWMRCAGATVVFDGVGAPTTQTFGLGMFDELTPSALDEMERFFLDRGDEVMHEVCPFAGTATLDLLCERGYRPIEISNVMYRAVDPESRALPEGVRVRLIDPADAEVWSDVSARGWTHEHPEFEEFVRDMGTVCVVREQSPCFLAEVDGTPGAA